MLSRVVSLALAVAALTVLPDAVAAQSVQSSDAYKFVEAVRGEKGTEVERMLRMPGSILLNSQDPANREGALHVIVRKGNTEYLRYFLAQPRIDVNLRDVQGNTPIMLAASMGQGELVDLLIAARADVNQHNTQRDTPLMAAVKRNDLIMAQALLTAGANPDAVDSAGKSARDLATDNPRNVAMAKLLAEAPKKVRRAVSGPGL